MARSRIRTRRKEPSEKQKPFFDKHASGPTFFGGNQVQRKLNVGKSNDASEKEAESVARNIVQKADKKEEEQPVQKADKKEEEKPVQKAEKKEEEKPVQKADKKEEEKPVQKAEKKEEEQPVQKADKKEEEKPVQKAEKKEEEKPVQKADKKEEEKPVQKAEKKEEEKPVQKADKKEEDKPVQKADKEEEAPVQAKAGPRIQKAAMVDDVAEQGDTAPTFENLLVKRKGMGVALPDELGRDMEGKFRTSFKEVRIHTDKEAAEMCEAIRALAFAHGSDIYFNEGKYNPEALSGRELLAHELAHIVQQNG